MKNKINIFYWWLFFILYLELVYKIFILKNFFSFSTISIIVFSLIFIIINTFLTSLFNKKINKILTIILTIFISIIFIAQIVYYNFYNSIFSIFSLFTGTGQVLHFIPIIINVILRIWYILFIILVPIILFLIYNSKVFNYNKINLKYTFSYLMILVFSFLSIICFINIDKDNNSLKTLLYKTHAPLLTINKTGLLTMEVIDVYRYIFGFNEKISTQEINNIEYDSNIYNVDNINYKELINLESDNVVKKMHTYFNNLVPSKKNEMTGLFKGKNLIFITAESFDTIGIDEKLTPTLYKMVNNSFVFNNYYQPLYPISTFDGEYMNLLSLIPKEGTWSFSQTSDMNLPYGIGNIFSKNNYNTYAFHNYQYNFYNRQFTHTNLGFNYIACGNGLEKLMNCDNWPNSDLEMINKTLDLYINDQPFVAYYMTVSGHLYYSYNSNDMSKKNKDSVDKLNYNESIKSYLATEIELDKAMESLLNELSNKGILDDTLIVIAPDHYPYGLTKNDMNKISEYNRKDKFENYHTSLIMYNPNIERKEINEVISSLDIIPTIYNLYDLNYDSRLFMGRDIFSEDEHIVILSDRSWITNVGSYNSINKKFTSRNNEKVTQEYIDRINKIVNEKFSISSLILDKKYYEKLGM